MAKVSRFQIEPCKDIHIVKTEIDDIFDEIAEKGVKTENERDDVFDEYFERQIDLSSHDLDLENKLTLTVKCLYKEEEDDVFDEEREKTENALTRHDVGFVNIDTGIKVELIEDDINYVKYDDIKENKTINSNTENVQSVIEVAEQTIKVEGDIKSERIVEYNCPKCTFKTTQGVILENHTLSHMVGNSKKRRASEGTQIEVEQNDINVNNVFEIIEHSFLGGRKKVIVSKTAKHVGEQQTETNKIKLREQNANICLDKTRDGKKLRKEIRNFNESVRTSSRIRLSKDKQKENSTKSCSKNVVENFENITDKEVTIDGIRKEISDKTVSRDTIKERTLQENKSQRENDGQRALNEKNQSVSVSNKTLNEEGKGKCHEKQSLKLVVASYEKEKKLHKEMEPSETVSKENIRETLSEKTLSNSATINNVNNDTPLENIEYCCTKCSFRTKQRTMFKTHLVKHGTEFFSGVISFLDLVNEKVSTSQVESVQDQDETKEQCTVGTHITERNEVQTDNDEKLAIEDVEACKSSQFSCELTEKNDIRVTGIANNQLCIENDTVHKRNEIVVLGKEDGDFLAAEKNLVVILENSANPKEGTQKINKNVNSGIKLLESEIENKRKVDNRNKNGEFFNEGINSVTTVINKEKEETPFNKSEDNILKAVSNVDSRSENITNAIMENKRNQLLKTNEVRLRSGKPNKRKHVGKPSSPSKKIKLENDNMYRCDECSYQSHKKRYLDGHKSIHSKDVIKCDHCSFTTNLQRYLNIHMLVHLQPDEIKMHKCPHCSYQTKRRGDLTVHMVLHRKPEETQMFQCDKCSYKTKRKTNLRSHQLSHKSADDVTVYSCTMCSFTAKKKYTIKSHMIVHQKMEEIEWYKCYQCSYRSKYKASLARHCIVHKNLDEIKTYDCHTCNYKAKHKSHLNSHLLIHKDPKEVEMHHCSHCPYKSIKKCNLVAHMVQHKKTEEINMKKCGHCPYQTKLKCNLIKHLNRIHRRA